MARNRVKLADDSGRISTTNSRFRTPKKELIDVNPRMDGGVTLIIAFVSNASFSIGNSIQSRKNRVQNMIFHRTQRLLLRMIQIRGILVKGFCKAKDGPERELCRRCKLTGRSITMLSQADGPLSSPTSSASSFKTPVLRRASYPATGVHESLHDVPML